jgi:hypothetical protein
MMRWSPFALNSCIGAVITKLTYDYDMKQENDPFVELAEKAADNFSQSAAPGAWLVDIFPWSEFSIRTALR